MRKVTWEARSRSFELGNHHSIAPPVWHSSKYYTFSSYRTGNTLRLHFKDSPPPQSWWKLTTSQNIKILHFMPLREAKVKFKRTIQRKKKKKKTTTLAATSFPCKKCLGFRCFPQPLKTCRGIPRLGHTSSSVVLPFVKEPTAQLNRRRKILLKNLVVAYPLEKFSVFMEPVASLPCSQGPATGSCAEPHEFDAHSHPFMFKIHFNIIFACVLVSCLQISRPRLYFSLP
jgi:hypothetical protein